MRLAGDLTDLTISTPRTAANEHRPPVTETCGLIHLAGAREQHRDRPGLTQPHRMAPRDDWSFQLDCIETKATTEHPRSQRRTADSRHKRCYDDNLLFWKELEVEQTQRAESAARSIMPSGKSRQLTRISAEAEAEIREDTELARIYRCHSVASRPRCR